MLHFHSAWPDGFWVFLFPLPFGFWQGRSLCALPCPLGGGWGRQGAPRCLPHGGIGMSIYLSKKLLQKCLRWVARRPAFSSGGRSEAEPTAPKSRTPAMVVRKQGTPRSLRSA